MVNFLWNTKGAALLTLLSTNFDGTGNSYYEEIELMFMDIKGTVELRIEIPYHSPIYDSVLRSTCNEFIIFHSFILSRTNIFNYRCESVYLFGTVTRNNNFSLYTDGSSPSRSLVIFLALLNLGQEQYFSGLPLQSLHNALELVSMLKVLSMTKFPHLRVYKGLRVFGFEGKGIHSHIYKDRELYQVVFRPPFRGIYADPEFTVDDMIGGAVKAFEKVSANGTQEKKVVFHRHPGSRGVAPSVVTGGLI